MSKRIVLTTGITTLAFDLLYAMEQGVDSTRTVAPRCASLRIGTCCGNSGRGQPAEAKASARVRLRLSQVAVAVELAEQELRYCAV